MVLALHPYLLTSRYAVAPPAQAHDPVLPRWAAAVCLVIGPAFAAGLPPWAVSAVAAAVLLTVTALRSPQTLRRLPVPWAMAAGFAGLSAAVALLQHTGWLAAVATAMGRAPGSPTCFRCRPPPGCSRTRPTTCPPSSWSSPPSPTSRAACSPALIGANAGPLVTPWASLVTLLWLQRCRAAGLRWRLGRLAVAGLLCSSLCVTAAVVALWATTP